jgi:hypothetical protein
MVLAGLGRLTVLTMAALLAAIYLIKAVLKHGQQSTVTESVAQKQIIPALLALEISLFNGG